MNDILQTRIERLSIPEPNTGCWLWLGAPTTARYGTEIALAFDVSAGEIEQAVA